MLNSLSDPHLVSQYHQEYLNLIKVYSNYKRTGSFIRYYNINFDDSVKHPDTLSTFDLYSLNSIKFDIYELTPTFNISPIVSSTSSIAEKKGQMYDGVTTIALYTIKVPRINDIITFYDPVKSGEIYRVNNIRTSINAYYSDPKLTWYEMDLEVAPIKDTSQLKISKHYIFDSHKEKYYNYEDFKIKTNLINNINKIILDLEKYYSRNNDLYCIDYKLVPYICNHSIIYFKDRISLNNSIHLFEDLKKPYGFLDKFSNEVISYDYTVPIKIYNLETDETEYYDWVSGEESNEGLNSLLQLTQELFGLLYTNPDYF